MEHLVSIAVALGSLLLAGAVLFAAARVRAALRETTAAVRAAPAPSVIVTTPAQAPAEPEAAARLERLERTLATIDERLDALQAEILARGAPPVSVRRSRAEEIRALAARGRNAVEIAQLLDADVGEIELVLQLESAARQRRSP